MKKKIFGVFTAIAIAATVAFSMNINSDINEFSALTMNNIEALASGESPTKTKGTVIPCHIYEGGTIVGMGNSCGGSNSNTCYSNPCI